MGTHFVNGNHVLKVRVKEFCIPPIKDGLVLGKSSPVGCKAIRKALSLLVPTPFEHIELHDDPIVSDILVRAPILRRVPKDRLISFILTHIKPLMAEHEIMHLEIDAEIMVEEQIA